MGVRYRLVEKRGTQSLVTFLILLLYVILSVVLVAKYMVLIIIPFLVLFPTPEIYSLYGFILLAVAGIISDQMM